MRGTIIEANVCQISSFCHFPHCSPNYLIQKSFVCTLDDDNSCKATILCKIKDHEAENHENIKFPVELGNIEPHEIIGTTT